MIGGHIHEVHGVVNVGGITYVNAAICAAGSYGKGYEAEVIYI